MGMKSVAYIWAAAVIVGLFAFWFANHVMNEDIRQSPKGCQELQWMSEYPQERCK